MLKIVKLYSDDIRPWLVSAKLVIFNRCTTGIEGFLLNKNIVSLDPIIEKDPLKNYIHLYAKILSQQKSSQTEFTKIKVNFLHLKK